MRFVNALQEYKRGEEDQISQAVAPKDEKARPRSVAGILDLIKERESARCGN